MCLADDVFQLLHLTVAVLFAEQLQKDLEALNKGNKPAVSLAAKWAPTPASKQQQSLTSRHPACAHQAPLPSSIADNLRGLILWFAWNATAASLHLPWLSYLTLLRCMTAGSHDKDTLMAARIAELLFPAGQHRSQDEAYNDYIARIKLMYHKQVLVPLRACLDVPEVGCYNRLQKPCCCNFYLLPSSLQPHLFSALCALFVHTMYMFFLNWQATACSAVEMLLMCVGVHVCQCLE